MSILIVLASLILAAIVVNAIFTVLMYGRLQNLLVINGAYQAESYRQAVAEQGIRKPMLPAKKEKQRGRAIQKEDDLIDISELPWEEGIKAIEEMGQ